MECISIFFYDIILNVIGVLSEDSKLVKVPRVIAKIQFIV